MNRAVASEFPAPVPYLPMFPSISATLLVEICLGYVLLAYSLWYFVIHFGNSLRRFHCVPAPSPVFLLTNLLLVSMCFRYVVVTALIFGLMIARLVSDY